MRYWGDINYNHEFKGEFEVSVNMQNFISQWSDDLSDFHQWMKQNVGENTVDWGVDVDPAIANHALFRFQDRNIAINFKLVWA